MLNQIGFIYNLVRKIIEAIYNAIISFFGLIWDFFLSLIIKALEIIPVPDFLANASSSLQSMVNYFSYFANIFALDTGMAIIITAYIVRFTIRRIPFIG